MTQLPSGIWDRVADVRESVVRAMEEFAPRTFSFVFTNVLIQEQPKDRLVVDRLRSAAQRSGRRYLPVVLECGAEAIEERVANPSRREHRKWIDPAAVRQFVGATALVDITDLEPMRFNTVDLAADDVATAILDHLNEQP